MIPTELTRADVLAALAAIDREGVPDGRQSRGYDLVHNGRLYPPKYAIGRAVELALGRTLTSEEYGGGAETNGRLTRLGFTVVPK